MANTVDVEDHNLAERTKVRVVAHTEWRGCGVSFSHNIHILSLSQKWLRHRDRFFTLVWVTGNMVGIGYWLLLFPHASVSINE